MVRTLTSLLGLWTNFFVGILVETMTPKGHFEINWPLADINIGLDGKVYRVESIVLLLSNFGFMCCINIISCLLFHIIFLCILCTSKSNPAEESKFKFSHQITESQALVLVFCKEDYQVHSQITHLNTEKGCSYTKPPLPILCSRDQVWIFYWPPPYLDVFT